MLQQDDLLCMVTDGVIDARNRDGNRYGRPRLQALFAGLPEDATAKTLVDEVCKDVQSFVDGVEPADDVTVLAVRWIGPRNGRLT